MSTFIRSVDGYQLPEVGEIGVFWELADVTNIYSEDGFNFEEFQPDDFGMECDYPEFVRCKQS